MGLTYLSGNGTGVVIYHVVSTIQVSETCNLDFNGDADALGDGDGNDLAAIVSQAIVNNSSQDNRSHPGSGANSGGGCLIGTLI